MAKKRLLTIVLLLIAILIIFIPACNDVKTYTVTFDYNGGEGTVLTKKVKEGSLLGELPVLPEKEDFVFGWYLPDKNIIVTAETVYNFGKDITLVAQYSPDTPYTLTFNLDGGEFPKGYSQRTVYTKSSKTFIIERPSKKGYNFTGYTGTDLTEPTTWVTIRKGSTGDRTFTAHYEPIIYTVTLNLTCYVENISGQIDKVDCTYKGKKQSELTPKQIAYGGTYSDLVDATAPKDFRFKGWVVENQSTGEKIPFTKETVLDETLFWNNNAVINVVCD